MLSVIIPACQEDGYIAKTLNSLYNQDFGDFEAIIVCNGCTDNTAGIAKGYPVKLFSLKEGDVSAARNFGAKNSSGRRLVFLDADIRVTKDTLKAIAEADAGLGSCMAKPHISKPVASFFMGVKNAYQLFASSIGISKGASTGLVFCDREVFEKAGGFEEGRTKGEDGSFIKRARKHSKFRVVRSYVVNDMRRFEKTGYLSPLYFWIRESVLPTKAKYPVIR